MNVNSQRSEAMLPTSRNACESNRSRRRKMHCKDSLRTGLWCQYSPDVDAQYQNAVNSEIDFIVVPIINGDADEFKPVYDKQLQSSDWTRFVKGRVITDDIERDTCDVKKIEAQLSYCAHLALPVIIFECPESKQGIIRLARIINARVSASAGLIMSQIWINVRMSSSVVESFNSRNDVDGVNDYRAKSDIDAVGLVTDPWQQWNLLRSMITIDRRVGVVLELSSNLPSAEELDRWSGEPVKALHIPTDVFVTNSKGYPVLSKFYQQFVKIIIEKSAREVQFIVRQTNVRVNLLHHVQYIDHIKKSNTASDTVSQFARGYEDYLQIPLQPLMDNLESCTYEIFEKDPVKYKLYQEAIKEVMKTKPDIDELIVMVVGAGRGPLVDETLSAAESLKRKVFVYAVEKNPNAVLTLKTRRDLDWGGEESNVKVIDSDMRDWVSPRKADIVVSELLGSFGDNELSPECLDGVWRCVKEDTVSIPASYKSFLAPIQSQKLHCEATNVREKDKPWYTPYEWGYVVHLKNYYLIDKPQPLFSFDHSQLHKPPSERDNSRFGSLEFKATLDCVCHGFAGYFEATLFGNIKFGTVYGQQTPEMFSWFPIYFPVANPIQVKANEVITVNFWRLFSKRAVWYEWCVTSPMITCVHNPNGRSQQIGLY